MLLAGRSKKYLITLLQVSKYFQEVFEKLCPLGRGTLSIKRDDSNDDVSEIFDVMTKVLVKLKIWSG